MTISAVFFHLLMSPWAQATELTYRSPEIQQVFSKCTHCHGPGKPFEFLGDWTNYESVTNKINFIYARAVEQVPSPMPPQGQAPLTDEERLWLADWIEGGGPY